MFPCWALFTVPTVACPPVDMSGLAVCPQAGRGDPPELPRSCITGPDPGFPLGFCFVLVLSWELLPASPSALVARTAPPSS